jgi:hypothetical protein
MMRSIDSPEPMKPELVIQSTAPVTPNRYRTNVTTLTERIAIRLAGEGAEHPVAAAVAIAVRGMLRAEPADYAVQLDLPLADVRALEAGTVALSALPASLWRLVHDHGLEPVMLVDLDRRLRGDGSPAAS